MGRGRAHTDTYAHRIDRHTDPNTNTNQDGDTHAHTHPDRDRHAPYRNTDNYAITDAADRHTHTHANPDTNAATTWRTVPLQRVEYRRDTRLEPGRVAGAADRFVEFLNPTQNTLDLAGYTVTTQSSAGIVDTYTIPRGAWRPGGLFVVFGDQVDVPDSGTVYLRNAAGTLLAMLTRGNGPGAGQSWQWTGSTYVAGLPTPGQHYGWWNTNPTPTAVP